MTFGWSRFFEQLFYFLWVSNAFRFVYFSSLLINPSSTSYLFLPRFILFIIFIFPPPANCYIVEVLVRPKTTFSSSLQKNTIAFEIFCCLGLAFTMMQCSFWVSPSTIMRIPSQKRVAELSRNLLRVMWQMPSKNLAILMCQQEWQCVLGLMTGWLTAKAIQRYVISVHH